jgi:hypothetical protein
MFINAKFLEKVSESRIILKSGLCYDRFTINLQLFSFSSYDELRPSALFPSILHPTLRVVDRTPCTGVSGSRKVATYTWPYNREKRKHLSASSLGFEPMILAFGREKTLRFFRPYDHCDLLILISIPTCYKETNY